MARPQSARPKIPSVLLILARKCRQIEGSTAEVRLLAAL